MTSVGNWVLADFTACNLPEKVATGFGEAMSKLVGARYTPLLYAASQIVNGTNHMIICEAVPMTVTPEPRLVAVYIHEALLAYGGDFRLLSVKPIEVGAF
ncbi:hypothetical protein OXPF_29440 [Oxobacter pfennigii]|uniref:Uncharacterized protein n=1 Tax=Oxobacter pfennigii TaxID=36849 RepID=A0A0P8W4J8_9CLOT|nr:hypothetical protein [Oxobacter pfennigii]KPU43503.1 hypothetical protein OXPF_29440 [Oxobacter pfennigii]